ncbi:TetR/AcrR family transcriptional regulator [Kineosporia sp. NBRC 101731]|uniref:TetR/AcrR family transcriptional regulator n=1 Tax=Kineosporia sp. NBRC 101731 TaxID=3032199 RepID=UPI0024A32DE1|nr:TetR/AcrR family transcriptional regulator [Kineosporia sp. NBRC 101731]GLY26762.1 TetR family transcriptional regulator [Kineosporia sp. NBRC 101731]
MATTETDSVRPSKARERLLRTASALFYTEGIHEVGVDRILNEAEVTRSTFYRHFPGKEDLVVNYIHSVDDAIRSHVDGVEPESLLEALIDEHAEQICQPGFRGCAFINAAAEYPDQTSPVRVAIEEHRSWMLGAATEAFRRAGHDAPDRAGRRFMLLRDGAMVSGYLHDPESARATLREGIDDLLEDGRSSS